ncbi:MAG: ABC transporter permease subunit [bacterium]
MTTDVATVKKSALAESIRKNRTLIYMSLPFIFFFILFHYIPMYGIIIAFKQFSLKLGILDSPWCGWENFSRLFGGVDFLKWQNGIPSGVLVNTLYISILRLTLGFFAPILLALMLNEIRISWFKRSVQTLTYLPFFLSWVILGGIFLMVFSQSDKGPLNSMILGLFNWLSMYHFGAVHVAWITGIILLLLVALLVYSALLHWKDDKKIHAVIMLAILGLFSLAILLSLGNGTLALLYGRLDYWFTGGMKPVEFLTNGNLFITTIIVTGIWHGAGYGAVIYLAALSGIDPTLYEAAMVDGASRWKQVVHITLPCLAPTIITLLILSAGGILNAGFDQIYNMYNPMVIDKAEIIDTYVLKRMMALDFGLATAAGLFKAVVGMAMIVLVNSIAKKMTDGEQGVW